MFIIRFMTLMGTFAEVKQQKVATLKEALSVVTEYAEAGGYTNVKLVDSIESNDEEGYRITAKTPGGRGGRNVAFVDADYDFSEEG